MKSTRLTAKAIRISLLNFTAINLQLYKVFKITRVSFFGTQCTIQCNMALFNWKGICVEFVLNVNNDLN